MTVLVSGAAPGARIVATVAWYDVAKDYGFLTPGGGLPDIFCHVSALQDVGLDILLQGATVTCEVVQGDRGPQVARIHAVDFSTASVIPASGNGRMREDRVSPQVRLPSSDRRIRALVKWFVPTKGYGFLVPEDGSADIFCHGTVVQASGYDVLPQGAMVTCEVVEGRKGLDASRILAVDVPASGSGVAENGALQRGSPDPEWRDQGADGLAIEVQGAVKFYDAGKGFGFVVPDDGGREVFVHVSVLTRSGLDELQAGQRVSVWAEEHPRGLQATGVELI